LRERLQYCNPLQKLYERIFFDDFNMERALVERDNFKDGTVRSDDFRMMIIREVTSIDPLKEMEELMLVVPRTSDKDERVLYKRLSDELRDLARLKLPLNFLYERHFIQVQKVPVRYFPDQNTQQKFDIEEMFSYKDPRLRHLNESFKRKELQVLPASIELTGSQQEEYRVALEEIIKFNCFTNEFNYMHELFWKLQNELMVQKGVNWAGLFSMFDVNKDNLMDKTELK